MRIICQEDSKTFYMISLNIITAEVQNVKLFRLWFVCKVYDPINIFCFSEHVNPLLTSSSIKRAHVPEDKHDTWYLQSTHKTSAKSLEVVL